MEPKDLRIADIIRKEGDDKLYVVIAAFPEKVVVQHTLDLMDLTGWEKVEMYGKVRSNGPR